MPPAATETTRDIAPSRVFLAALVALTFVMNAIGRGVSETFAVFLLPVEQALAVDRAGISATYAVFMVAYALAAPLAGQVIDRMGARVCYGLGLASLGSGYLLAAGAQSIWTYYLTVGVLGGIGAALLGMVAASSLLVRWFTARMGLMSALPYAAVGCGMLVFPPLTQILIERYGWRVALAALGGVTLAGLTVVAILPLGRITAGSVHWRAMRTAATSGQTAVWPLSTAVRTRAFAALFLAYFATSVAAYAVLPHSVAHLVERGFEPLAAAGAFGLNGIMSAFGIIAMGWLSDRFGRLPTVTASYLVTMAGIASLMLIAIWPTPALVYAYAILFGLMQGARGPILVALVAKIFNGGSVGAIFGTLSMALGLGAAFGSWASGVLRVWSGGYVLSFAMALAACLVGLATFWLAKSIREERAA